MSLWPITSKSRCCSSFKKLFKSSGASSLNPPKTYLQMKWLFRSCSSSVVCRQKRSPNISSLYLKQNNEVISKRTFGSKPDQALSKRFFDQSEVWTKSYEDLIGLTNLKNVQGSLTQSEKCYLDSKEKRKEVQHQLDELNFKLRKPRPPSSIGSSDP